MAQRQHRKFIQTVLSLILVLSVLNPQKYKTDAKECQAEELDGALKAFCPNYGLTKIPDNLDVNIVAMEVSRNSLTEIKKSDMQRYQQLADFIYNGPYKGPNQPPWPVKLEPDAFAGLPQLKSLVLNNLDFGSGTKLIFPPNLVKLQLVRTLQNDSTLDVSNLEQLEVADLDENFLASFPKFHLYAPLVVISLLTNPVGRIPVLKIARYCNLSHLVVKVEDIKPMLSDPCECLKLKQWLTLRRIGGFRPDNNFLCNIDKANPCKQPLITDKMNRLYENCKNNIRDSSNDDDDESTTAPGEGPKKKSKSLLLYLFLLFIFVAVATVTITLIIYHLYRKRRRKIASDTNSAVKT